MGTDPCEGHSVCSHADEVKTGFPDLTGEIARLQCLILQLVVRTVEYKIRICMHARARRPRAAKMSKVSTFNMRCMTLFLRKGAATGCK